MTLAALAAGALGARPALALDSETFDDYRTVGTGESTAKKVGDLFADGHVFQGVIDEKLLDVFTPHVFATQSLGFTTNAFHTGTNETSTATARTSVGVRGDFTVAEHVLSIGWRGGETFYFDADQVDYFDQTTDARLDLNFANVRFHGEAAYSRVLFPGSIQILGLAVGNVYSTQEWVEARLNKIGGKVGLSYRRSDFESSGSLRNLAAFDNQVVGVNVQGNYRIGEKLDALAEYDFEATRFDRPINRDLDAHQVRGGLNGTVTEKLTLSLKAGFTMSVPRGKNTTNSSAGYRGFNAALAASWTPLPPLVLTATYRRDLTWAVAANYQTVDAVSVTAAYKFGPSERASAAVTLAYAHAEPDSGGHLDRFTATLNLGFKVTRWLDASAFYGYEQVLATGRFRASEYDEHRLGVSVAVGF